MTAPGIQVSPLRGRDGDIELQRGDNAQHVACVRSEGDDRARDAAEDDARGLSEQPAKDVDASFRSLKQCNEERKSSEKHSMNDREKVGAGRGEGRQRSPVA